MWIRLVEFGIVNATGLVVCVLVLVLTFLGSNLFGIPNLLFECLALLFISYTWGVRSVVKFQQGLLLILIVSLLGFLFDPFLFQPLFGLETGDAATWIVSFLVTGITGGSLLVGYVIGTVVERSRS